MSGNEEVGTKGVRRPAQVLKCGWCGGTLVMPWRGRTPKWCSPSCRTRAWAARRAAEAGDAEVRVVDRQIEVVREVSVEVEPQSVAEWSALVRKLAKRLDNGRVYDRDWPALVSSVEELSAAVERREKRRRERWRR